MDDAARPSLPADAAALLPQKPPMRLVTRLLAVTEEEALAECVLDAASPFADQDGHIAPVAFIEMAAQACAAARGHAAPDGPAREGFLVGVKDFVCPGRVRAGEPVHVRIRPVAELDGFILVDADIFLPGAANPSPPASLRVKLYCPEPAPS